MERNLHRSAGIVASLALAAFAGCSKTSDKIRIPPPGLSPTPSNSNLPTAPQVPSSIPIVPAPALKAPAIFGFSSPRAVLQPTSVEEHQIIEQLKRGVTEVPVYLGGSVTPDGKELRLQGFAPDLKPFMDLLKKIEVNGGLNTGTIRLRPYLRASLTAEDASAQPSAPGKISLNDPAVRSSLISLTKELLSGKYGLDASRVDELTLDFENITASNFDPQDLAPGDEGNVTQLASLVKELRAAGVTQKLGLYCAGILNSNWFPSETAQPVGSPFKNSPRDFVSPDDVKLLLTSGVDVLEVGAYSVFPNLSGAGGFANPNLYGPIHAEYASFVGFHIDTVKGLGFDPEKRLRLLVPVFSGSDIVPFKDALAALKDRIRTGLVNTLQSGVFDFGNMDAQEQADHLAALR